MTYQTALQLVQRLCNARGITQPSALLTATDPGIIQMRTLLEESVSELTKRSEWQATTIAFTFATVAAQVQGYLDTNTPGSSAAGTQSVLLSGNIVGGTATGLANDATSYTATIKVDGVNRSIAIAGSTIQTYSTLISNINAQLTGGVSSLGNNLDTLLISSSSTGLLSSIAITDGVTHPLFASLTLFSLFQTAIPGTAGFVAAGSGFMKIINETLWNSTRHLPLFGPRKMQDIAMLTALPVTGPFYQYNIWQNQLNILPTPAAGDTIIGWYQSRNGWTTSTGASTSEFIANDTDVPVLDSDTAFLGLKWRWLETKGLAYDDEKMQYEVAVMDLQIRDRPRAKRSLSGQAYGYFDPVVIIPAGSWSVQT